MIAELDRAKNIKPPSEFEDYCRVVVPYLMQCIEENTDMEWVESRYLAGQGRTLILVTSQTRDHVYEMAEAINAILDDKPYRPLSMTLSTGR